MFKYFRSPLLRTNGLRFYQQKYDPKKDYYKVLGLIYTATDAEIKKAYRSMVIKYHPDKEGGSETKIKEINEAKEVLLDSDIKKQYDEARKLSGGHSGYSSQGQSQSSSQYTKNTSSSYGDQYNRQRNTRFYENADWGPDPFAEFYKKAQGQQAQQSHQQYQNTQNKTTRKKFFIYRDRFGNEYVIQEEDNGSQGPDPHQQQREYQKYQEDYKSAYQNADPYQNQRGTGFDNMDRMFREFREGFKGSHNIFDEMLNEQRKKAKREEEYKRQQMKREAYSDISDKQRKLEEDLRIYGRKAKDAFDVFRHSAEDKGFIGGLKDAFSFLKNGAKRK